MQKVFLHLNFEECILTKKKRRKGSTAQIYYVEARKHLVPSRVLKALKRT